MTLPLVIDPRRLLTFREVAHRRSFSRAAEALALTQPAVSQQVAALERQLGVRLLDRGPGGPAPTEVGALLLAHADAVAERLAQAGAQVAERVTAERETLRAGAFPSALSSIVPTAIAQLHDERPSLQIEVVEGAATENGAAVARRDAARRGLLPGHRDPAPGAERHRAPRAGRGADAGDGVRRSIRSPARSGSRCASWRRDLDRAVARAPRAPRLRRRGLRAADRVRQPRPAGDRRARRARARGDARARLLAGRLPGVAMLPLRDTVPRRDLYALTPAAGTRPAALAFVAALAAAMPCARSAGP